MRVITRSAAKRVLLVFFTLTILVAWCYSSMIRMPLKSFGGPLPALTAEQSALAEELRRHIEKLAGEIGERNVYRPAQLHASADCIENAFATAGLQVTRQTYTVMGEDCANLEVEIPGNRRRGEIVVVGAHYDSVFGSPGANDNASGVATLLALARVWAARETARTLRFVAFVNEEPPFFQTEQMGSLVYARRCRQAGDQIVAMLSLETMGSYITRENSQQYPFPVGLFYPSRGDFIAFVGNTKSADLVRRCIRAFREQVSFPSEGAALPGNLPGIAWSDHWSFWQAGYPAIMITDTAPFRYPHYHSADDLPDKLNYELLARVVEGLHRVLDHLANPNS